MKNILKLAAFFLLSGSSVLATSAPMPIAQDQPSTARARFVIPMLRSNEVKPPEATAHFTAPEFCYVGKMKVACTLTDAPSKDPTGTQP
ncbi:hypothetical protein [Deinococcus hopiensis]|uniref:Uncharacterized protein n=1 Tax=Deinococcus hopiensis KR-140 TaxID=695939 RepID=A0A1W1UW81_9DEIO|nr:hypothetical protein [Deinococcus hopiensis]SMB85408.1 hypothetical protein SAMN00790413_03390 [Deinococcus hopiensis KR-140]